MISQELIDYFSGDLLAANVWYNKYRAEGENLPSDSEQRYANELVGIYYDRLKTLNPDVFENLSAFGKLYYTEAKSLSKDELRDKIKQDVNLKHIVPGGSLLQGLGQLNLYSSLSNCLVLGVVHDSYAGISDMSEKLVQTCKRRMGNGMNLSGIRPNGSTIHNQATWSSGVVPYAERFSHLTKEVAQFGRRGACMLNIDINHPDSLEFAESKQDLTRLTGVNISVIFDTEFMEAVFKYRKDSYLQRFPIDADITNLNHEDFEYNKLTKIESSEHENMYVKRINPIEAWNKIIEFAWKTGEPGLLFKCNWRDYGVDYCYDRYRPVSTNPCSEIPMQANDSCRLMSLNLYSLIEPDELGTGLKFNFEKLYTLAYMQQTYMDVIVDLDIEYINNILNKIKSDKTEPEKLKQREIDIWEDIQKEAKCGRRTGSGFTGLGDVLMALNYGYNDNPETLEFIEAVFKTKMRAELDATIDMSVLFGSFEGFDWDLEQKASDSNTYVKKTMFKNLLETFPEQMERMKKFGRRNVSWSTAAPTGSLSILTQTTSGVEPMFEPFSFRRVKCTKPTDRVDFIDPADGQKFTVYKSFHFRFIMWISQQTGLSVSEVYNLSKDELENYLIDSPFYGNSANEIDWESRIKIQAIIQKYTTHAISSTVNLPNEAHQIVVSRIYNSAWQAGLKGITVFRDGCRAGIFDTGKVKASPDKFNYSKAFKRPKTIPAYFHEIQTIENCEKKSYYVFVGTVDSKPYEIFILDASPKVGYNFPSKGNITKVSKGEYQFEYGNNKFKVNTEKTHKEISLYLSMLLRHGTPLEYIIKVIDKTNPISGSFKHKLIKILSGYIPNNTNSGVKCPDCGDNLVYENGCTICKSCGHTKC